MSSLTYAETQEYITRLVPAREPEMQAMEEYARRTGFPIIGPAAGYACYQIARMIGAKAVFELGSGYGYSTAWFARAVKENGGGVVQHVVWDARLSEMAAEHMARLGYDGIVKYKVGEAVEALRGASDSYDLIFNDIDKEGYPASLPVIKQKLRRGGVLIIDNMLWSGRVLSKTDKSHPTAGVRTFTDTITHDPDWIVSLLPIRDGLIVALKQ